MPRRTIVDWDGVATAATHGVLTARALDELGVPRQTVYHRASIGGPWKRLLPGVIMLSSGTPTLEQRHDAALRYAGTGAMITGLAACRLHGMTRLPETDEVHMLIPEARKRASKGFAEIERTTRLPSPVTRDGFRVAPLVRALLDAARRLPSLDQVRALLAEAVQRDLVTPEALAAEAKAGSRRGVARCRVVLEEMGANVHSPAESWAYRLAQSSDLPAMQWNVRLLGPDGTLLGIPDGWIDEVGLAWQIDSMEYHLRPTGYENTVFRHTLMTAAGVVVVHTLPKRLRSDPSAVLDELRRSYRAAQQRPRPRVTAVPRVPAPR
ncbi:hypothetical protein GCM10027271_56150 [Saccharopolyspora gloriosae]|uniref:Transcriptional regulator, AbiEi antitoxin, Type IV TA system n=1 Tax=Saccharopolyspora gloriosae TaxID=455344 RepID=A0A840N6V2_9PSEU|nr:type IV toxin-antitoxin system AbiEi family antitoxin [Saccharopolyspora gloriosae]MBB5067700.1 hypothetical protein [Saccharopolyspora gloriosae]